MKHLAEFNEKRYNVADMGRRKTLMWIDAGADPFAFGEMLADDMQLSRRWS